MAYPEITEEVVYLTAGAAMPVVIANTFNSLLNDTFDEAYKKLLNVSTYTVRSLYIIQLLITHIVTY